MVGTANAETASGGGLMPHDRAQRLAAAEAIAIKALSVAPNHAFAHAILGNVYIWTNRAAQGIVELEHALVLNPNLARAHGFIGLAKIHIGLPEEAEAHVQRALRLSPRDAIVYTWLTIAGEARQHLGKHEEAIAWLNRSIDAVRIWPISHLYLAASLAQLGRLEEARAAVHAGLALDPTFTIRRFRAGRASDHPVYLTHREHVLDGLHKAGVPEG
jgi:tetratricopeptide (TPR) repeat protein